MEYTFYYLEPIVKEFTINIEKLANILIKELREERYEGYDVDNIITNFGDNMCYYLEKLGFYENDIENGVDYDKIYDDLHDKLKSIIDNKLK